MKHLSILLLSCMLVIPVCGQTAKKPANKSGAGGPSGKLVGRIVDAKNNRGIDAASVELFEKNTNALAGGMLTKPNGDFDISNVSVSDSFKLVVTAIGYAKQELTIAFNNKTANENGIIENDLGNIKLQADAKYLGAVTVVAQKPALQMSIDRKTFDVEKNVTSTGGTGMDVMRNIPSVTVDVDGNILLRNNS